MSALEQWYVVKQQTGQCTIVDQQPELEAQQTEIWGPFPSKSEAIARRVGLIRAGKCQPV